MRYPEDIFSAQTEQYALYHITDPVQYFNKQAIWDIAPSPDTSSAAPVASAVASGNNGGRNTTLPSAGSPIKPLYLTMGLPKDAGQQGPSPQQFLLERSFTPRLKGGILSAFVFAQSDGADYGKLVVYEVPDTAAPSPAQAATLIQSDQFISTQFTLLGSAGSRVIQGDVQLLPIGNAIMYVRPVWILGEGKSDLPALQVRRGRGRPARGARLRHERRGDRARDRQPHAAADAGRREVGRNRRHRWDPTTTTTTTTCPERRRPTRRRTRRSTSCCSAALDEYQAGQAALANKDLAGYQSHNARAQALTAQALGQVAATPPASTTVAHHATTVHRPSNR